MLKACLCTVLMLSAWATETEKAKDVYQCLKEKQPCDENKHCQQNLVCVKSQCVRKYSVGSTGPCEPGKHICAPGFYCNKDSICAKQVTKKNPTCIPPSLEYEPFELPCEKGYVCAPDINSTGTEVVHKCQLMFTVKTVKGSATHPLLCAPWLEWTGYGTGQPLKATCIEAVVTPQSNFLAPACEGNKLAYAPTCTNSYEAEGAYIAEPKTKPPPATEMRAPIWCAKKFNGTHTPSSRKDPLHWGSQFIATACLKSYEDWLQYCWWSHGQDVYKSARLMHTYRECAGLKHKDSTDATQGKYMGIITLDLLEVVFVTMFMFAAIGSVTMITLYCFGGAAAE